MSAFATLIFILSNIFSYFKNASFKVFGVKYNIESIFGNEISSFINIEGDKKSFKKYDYIILIFTIIKIKNMKHFSF